MIALHTLSLASTFKTKTITMQSLQQDADLLTAFDLPLIRASGGKRFLNYLVDLIGFYAIVFIVAALVAVLSPETLEGIDEGSSFNFTEQVLFLIFYAVYMSVMELVFKGKSLGKLLTGTRAVNLDGSTIDASKAFGRGFSRAVPFCVFSAFGSPCMPWQDRWTDTMVIDERQSATT